MPGTKEELADPVREPLLRVDALGVDIDGTPVLDGIGFSLARSRTLGIVGESGSGKSMTALALMGLLPRGAVRRGSLHLDGQALDALDEPAMRRVRGARIGMVFQEPMTALNPLHRIGDQVAESLVLHRGLSRTDARRDASAVLDRVGLSTAIARGRRYPHELSGGQRQRVVIAIAIACSPLLLIADEPTTALDVTTQAGILSLLRELQRDEGLALLFISHDLAVVADMADELLVMTKGEVVERGTFDEVFAADAHPYAQRLHAASTRPPRQRRRTVTDTPLLVAEGVSCSYPGPRRRLFGPRERSVAVKAVSLDIRPGESVGLVGESGCGKSTFARALLGLQPIDAGRLSFDGVPIEGGHTRATRRRVQVVFQDPYGSFDPRHRVARLVAEPLHLLDERPSRRETRRRVAAMLERVGIGGHALERYPHEFSGGQRQRIAIARALIVEPSLVVLDEAVSALDVSVRAVVLDLLATLADERRLAYLFISHDLSVVRRVTDRLHVMRAGAIVESGDTAAVFAAPRHPYTQGLLAAVPTLPALSGQGVAMRSTHRP